MIARRKLTFREAFDSHFKSPTHRPRTVEAYEDAIDRWEQTPVSVPGPPTAPFRRRKLRDPDLRDIDNRSLAEFRDAMLALRGQNTVRKWLTHLVAILNRIGPPTSRHPEAASLLSQVPVVRKPAEKRRPARIARNDELDRLYEACRIASWPHCDVDPVDWWQSLLVFLFNLGFRRSDFLGLRWNEIDLKAGLVRFDAEKTGKAATLPMPPVVVEHLQRIWSPRPLVWPWRRHQVEADPIDKRKTSLYRQWRRIQAAAGISTTLTLHDLRKTCGNELFWISPAAAQEVLQHASITTTQRSYADVSSPITRALLLDRQQPQAFNGSDRPDDDPPTIRFPGRAC